MGYDKLAFMQKASPDYIVSSDMSCLMHLQGCARRQEQDNPFLHIAEILNGV
jgi:L-lactate dehydrogenase complex protein LldE